LLGIDPEQVCAYGKQPLTVKAHSLLCYWSVRKLGYSATELSKRLGVSQPSVSISVRRGEKIVKAASNARDLANNVKLPFMDEASMAKAYTGHTAFEVVSDSLQMFGAYGYSQDMPLERMLRDVRMFQIGGGTSEAQMNMIARSIFKRKFELRK